MTKVVAKFGGSSLADADQFRKVKKIVEDRDSYQVVVPSAPGKGIQYEHKITDLLLMCYQLASHELNFQEVFDLIEQRFLTIKQDLGLAYPIEDELSAIKLRLENGGSRDYAASRGEYLNGLLLAEFLGFEFLDAASLFSFENGRIQSRITKAKIAAAIETGHRYVVPGFYGADSQGEIVTFPRGGSDISGAFIAAAIGADIYDNWTDVSGFLVADPKIIPQAQPMRIVSFKELRELSYMGAQVLHEEAIFPLRSRGIPIRIKNTNLADEPGTLIVADQDMPQEHPITGIAGKKGFVVVTLEKTLMTEDKRFLRKLISIFETNDVRIEHMPTGIDSISLVVAKDQLAGKERKLKEEISIYCEPDRIEITEDLALLAVVGRGMVRTKGIASKVFCALSQADINVRLISQGSSEISIIIGVSNQDFAKALQTIYRAFFSLQEE